MKPSALGDIVLALPALTALLFATAAPAALAQGFDKINTTVTKSNLHNFKEIFELADGLGASAWHIFLLVPVGCGVEIADQPRFPWRGLMLDTCRHFFPVEFVKRYIDTLAFHKMNVFHWHLTEDQGGRIENRGAIHGACKAAPDLGEDDAAITPSP